MSISLRSYKACNSFVFDDDDIIDDLILKCGQNLKKKTVPFEDIVPFNDDENIATYVDFDCCMTFYTETPTNTRQNNRARN